jgi:glycosyltransferase involved in cell wall biosynthesis
MKILFVSEYFPPKIMGGGEINVHLMAKTLAKKLDVHVVTSFHKGLKLYEVVDGIKVHRYLETAENVSSIKDNFKRSISFPKSTVIAVKKLVKLIKPDIIHFIGTSIIASKELSELKIPLVATIESYPALCPKGDRIFQNKKECRHVCSFPKFISCQQKSKEIGKMQNKFYLKYNPVFHGYVYTYFSQLRNGLQYCNLIAISNYISKVLLQHGHESIVISNMLEISKFKVKNKTRKKPVILYLGSLIKSKGPHILLQAVKGLDCKVKLYGKGILKETLLKFIKQNNLDAEIYDHVSYENIPQIYANSDLLIFPSVWPEPFGRIAIEAMAAGKPIVASEIGAISEIITPETGLLCKPNDVNDLRKKISYLLKNKLKVSSKLAEKYSCENVAESLINEYKRILVFTKFQSKSPQFK